MAALGCFIGFNHAIGINADKAEGDNEAPIVEVTGRNLQR